MERLCYATEFEIEGWKKIVPLTEILKKYTNVPFLNENPILKLKMEEFYAITEPPEDGFYDNSKGKFLDKFNNTKIENSEIYSHFENSKEALVIYVSHQMPINEKFLDYTISPHGNHCVVATGIEERNGVKCLVLVNTGRSEEENYIPVNFPFFEAAWNKIKDDETKKKMRPSDHKTFLNKYGFDLAQQKFQEVKKFKKARDFKDKHDEEWFNMKKKDGEFEYQMFFVKGSQPIHKLSFINNET